MINPDTRFSFSVTQQSKSGVGRLAGVAYKPHKITHTHGNSPLKESPDHRRGRYLYNTQQTQETNIHAFNGVRTRDTSNQEAADLRLITHGHRTWQYSIYLHLLTAHKVNHNTHYLPVFSKGGPNLGPIINH
jgi:hypothetical protein